ncbi:hypothetical protein LJB96_02750 [Methanobrevibacter sp. OttesenSCG-928-K11]|nr:hypothetical protein [Methanobrevibacter sp. OttesenSCG-928-K11]MDL2270528.1 hypothetical protein [Methanobrevibacter sp. OttesenSCG-928-I08]
MDKKFLEMFINEEMYLENRPLNTKEFITFCKKRGIKTNKEQLEMYEKEKFIFPLMRIKRDIETDFVGEKRYTQISFDDQFYPHEKDKLISLFNNGNIFDPSKYKFESWSSFKGELVHAIGDRTMSFYSSFQIFQIEALEMNISKHQHEDFRNILEFLLSIQSIYYPFAKSDSESIIISNNYERWRDKRLKFNPKKELSKISTNITDVASCYELFSRKSIDILGMGNDDWIQLMKNIFFKKKEKIKGKNRLGIEYMQWALMLKKYLEDYINRDVFDIDEVLYRNVQDILNINPRNVRSPRISRNSNFIDNNNKYHQSSSYKRKFFLANSFRLGYHPSVLVFVEGETEEMIIPKLYEWYVGVPPERNGIDIVNVKGVGNFASTYENSQKLKNLTTRLSNRLNKETKGKSEIMTQKEIHSLNDIINELKGAKILTNNFASLISHYLENWQTIPYFISDNEGDIEKFLDEGKPLHFENKYYGVPEDWKYVWGMSNKHSPFKGSCFEFSNFSNEEICKSLNEVLNKNISIEEVSNARNEDKGINKICKREISKNKLKINKSLFKNLCNDFSNTNDENLLKRPIFNVLFNLYELKNLNPMPNDFKMEENNKNVIKDILEGKRNFFIDK